MDTQMDTHRLQEYKKKLEKERGLLFLEIGQNETPKSFGNDPEDPDEETDKSEEFGNQLAVAQDLKNRLSEVDIALGKIQTGNYGVCEACGKPIGAEILDVDPESRFCKHCKAGK